MSRSVGAEIELQYSGFFNYRFALVMGTGRIHSEGRGTATHPHILSGGVLDKARLTR